MSNTAQIQASQVNNPKKDAPEARKPLAFKVLAGIAGLLAVCAIAFFAYTSDYYHAEETAAAALESTPAVSVVRDANTGDITFLPQDPQAVLVFYPGGKVEHTAYAPLMQDLAERNIACILVEMPFRLAVFDINAASDVRKLSASGSLSDSLPWYIGGHSLGGSMAAAHSAENADDYAGLVLLASYSTEDVSTLGLEVVSVYGSEDAVLNAEKYAENRANLGEDVAELVIEGGNHAQFGSYGAQDGDGAAKVSADEQHALTADFVAAAILG